jgi:hypothetical protein
MLVKQGTERFQSLLTERATRKRWHEVFLMQNLLMLTPQGNTRLDGVSGYANSNHVHWRKEVACSAAFR